MPFDWTDLIFYLMAMVDKFLPLVIGDEGVMSISFSEHLQLRPPLVLAVKDRSKISERFFSTFGV